MELCPKAEARTVFELLVQTAIDAGRQTARQTVWRDVWCIASSCKPASKVVADLLSGSMTSGIANFELPNNLSETAHNPSSKRGRTTAARIMQRSRSSRTR